jgi:hypothetical protein
MGLNFRPANKISSPAPKIPRREALRNIHQVLCEVSIEQNEPLIVRQKFEKINIDAYTDEQVKRILKGIVDVIKKSAGSQ